MRFRPLAQNPNIAARSQAALQHLRKFGAEFPDCLTPRTITACVSDCIVSAPTNLRASNHANVHSFFCFHFTSSIRRRQAAGIYFSIGYSPNVSLIHRTSVTAPPTVRPRSTAAGYLLKNMLSAFCHALSGRVWMTLYETALRSCSQPTLATYRCFLAFIVSSNSAAVRQRESFLCDSDGLSGLRANLFSVPFLVLFTLLGAGGTKHHIGVRFLSAPRADLSNFSQAVPQCCPFRASL
jgi:hypothetical protein